jgi:hypothetical protein
VPEPGTADGVESITVALNAAATVAVAGCGGTAALLPRTAASNSAVADANEASDSATDWSNSSALDARMVTSEPAADLTVMLIGASVWVTLLLN